MATRHRLGLLAGLVAVLAASLTWADSDPAELTSEQLWQDIHLFQRLNAWQLEAAQLGSLVELSQPLRGRAVARRERDDSPAAREALLALRAKLAAGEEPGRELWEQLERAHQQAAGPPVDEGNLERDARTAMAEFLKLLSPAQLTAIAVPDAGEQCEHLFNEANEMRMAPTAQWAQWRTRRIEDLTRDRGPNREAATAALEAAFEFARRLTPDEFHAKRDDVIQHFREALVPPLSDEELRERATRELLGQMFHNPRFGVCLDEYALAKAGDG